MADPVTLMVPPGAMGFSQFTAKVILASRVLVMVESVRGCSGRSEGSEKKQWEEVKGGEQSFSHTGKIHEDQCQQAAC